jgi:hypothetical protein
VEKHKQLEVSFGDGSSWLNCNTVGVGAKVPQMEHGEYYLWGKLAGWLEALGFVQGHSYGETKIYLKKIGLFAYEDKARSTTTPP